MEANMKSKKQILSSLLAFLLVLPLFFCSVFAEVPSTYTLDDTNLNGLLSYPDLDLSTDIVYIGNNGRIQIISPRFGSVSIANNEVRYTGKRIEYDGSKWNDVNANGTVTLGFSWGGVIFLNIPNQQKFCQVVTNASSVPDCVNQMSWSADFNAVLSNPYIAYLVGIARNSLIDEWYIRYSLIRSVNPSLNATVQYYGYRATFGLYSSDDVFIDSIVAHQSDGLSCDSSGYCVAHTAYNYTVSTKVVLQSNWLAKTGSLEVNDSKGNSLFESGNSTSQNASASIDSVTSDLNSSSGTFEQFEAQFNQNLSSNLELIDISNGNLGTVSDFVNTANFVKLQFDTILNNSGLYKTALTFSLILGLALLLIGRRS